MECPICNEQMKSGNILGDGRLDLIWKEDAALDDIATKIKLNKARKNPFKLVKVPSYLCAKCNKVIIDIDIKQ